MKFSNISTKMCQIEASFNFMDMTQFSAAFNTAFVSPVTVKMVCAYFYNYGNLKTEQKDRLSELFFTELVSVFSKTPDCSN